MEELLREMETYARTHHVPILRTEERGAFVRILEAQHPKKILEIGTAIGYSALLMALHGDAETRILSLERNEGRFTKAREFIDRSPYRDSIELRLGDAAKELEGLEGPFDFVFLDGPKGQYPRYFRQILPLLADRGAILADNVLFRGLVDSEEKVPRRMRTIVKRLREYLRLIRKTPGFTTEILKTGDGMALSRRLGYGEET